MTESLQGHRDPLDLILMVRFNDPLDVDRWFCEQTKFSIGNGTRIVRVMNKGRPAVVRMQGRSYIMLQYQIQAMQFRRNYIISVFRSGYFGLAVFNGVDRFLFSGFFNCPAYAGITLERQLKQQIFNPQGGEMAQAFGMGHRNFFQNVSAHPEYQQEMQLLMDQSRIFHNPRLPTHPRHRHPPTMPQQDVWYGEQVFPQQFFRGSEEEVTMGNPQEAEQLPQQHNPQGSHEEIIMGNFQDAQDAIFQMNPTLGSQLLVQDNRQILQASEDDPNVAPQQSVPLNAHPGQLQDAHSQVVEPEFDDENPFLELDFLGDINADQELFFAHLEAMILHGDAPILRTNRAPEQHAVKRIRLIPY